jgi:hypothetical protein
MATNSPLTNGALNFDAESQQAQSSIDQLSSDLKDYSHPPTATPAKTYRYQNSIFDPAVDLVTLSSANFNELFDELDFTRQYGYTFCIYSSDNKFQKVAYSFPLPPQSISISVPAAVSGTVTMKGYVEDHNGAPIRRISLRGTTGIYQEVSAQDPGSTGPNSLLSSLLKNTFQSAVRVANQATALAGTVSSIFSGSSPLSARINWNNSDVSSRKLLTGYEAAHTLYRFLDGYLAMKKQTANSKVRLCFEMHKDKMYYDCTLNNFTLNKIAGTLEYEYSIDLTAWRRQPHPPSGDYPVQSSNGSQANAINKLAQITQALIQTRALLSDSFNVLAGIRADVNSVFIEPLREAILLGGTLVSGVLSLSSFPQSIINSSKAGIISALKSSQGDVRLATIKASMIKAGYYSNDNNSPNYGLVNPTTSVLNSEFRETNDTNQAELNGINNDGSGFQLALNDPSVAIPMLDQFTIDEIPMTSAQQTAVQNEINRVQSLTATDLRNRRTSMESFANSIAQAFGGGSTTFNRVNNYTNSPTTKKLQISDIILMSQINDAIMAYDSLIAQMESNVSAGNDDYYSYYANVARENNIAFTQSQSKYYVPFPYGMTMEALAVQYLGDAQRWIEIAAINGLQEPYIDESGFNILFQGNGAGNTLTLPNADDLFIGQTILITSNTQSATSRKITGITVESAVESIVTVDGDPTMSLYRTADSASLKAFLPNTLNSLKMVAIPSNDPVGVPQQLKITPGANDLDPIMVVAQTDFLLLSSGDLAIDAAGNVGIATGVQNLTQAAKLKLLTKAGSLVNDPSWGNPVSAGQSTAETNAPDILSKISSMFAQDPRFGKILAGSVSKFGPSAEISILVKIAGTNLNLPLVVQAPL